MLKPLVERGWGQKCSRSVKVYVEYLPFAKRFLVQWRDRLSPDDPRNSTPHH